MKKEDALRIYLDKPLVIIDRIDETRYMYYVDNAIYMVLTEAEGEHLLKVYQEYEMDEIKDRVSFKKERKLFDFVDWNAYFLGETLEDYGFTKMNILGFKFYFTKL